MTRYVAKPRACGDLWYEEDETFAFGLTVYEPDDEPTGILDAQGNEYHRARAPMGFIWRDHG